MNKLSRLEKEKNHFPEVEKKETCMCRIWETCHEKTKEKLLTALY